MKQTTINFKLLMLMLLFLGSGVCVSGQSLTNGLSAVVTCYGANGGNVAGVKQVGNQTAVTLGSNWIPPAISPAVTNWTAAKMGQVFGTAIDDAGNVYFASTTMYAGCNTYVSAARLAQANPGIVAAGDPCGYGALGGAAGIYKADAANLNNVTALTTTVNSSSGGGVGTSTIPNTGYALGNIAFASGIGKLYAVNLEDGKIYCINTTSGNIDFDFDPFVSDASGAAMARYNERIFAVGINTESNGTRLYYSRLKSETESEIWSVGLNANGSFDTDNNLEIIVPKARYNATFISDIAFSKAGAMLIAEKGEPHQAKVYQYFGVSNAWSIDNHLTVPGPHGGAYDNSAGGVDYGSTFFNGDYTCDELIWSMANYTLGPGGNSNRYYGLVSQPLNGYTNPATFSTEAYIVDLDGNNGGAKGGFGDVETYDTDCKQDTSDLCKDLQASVFKINSPDSCCFEVGFSNGYRADYFTSVTIGTKNLQIASISGNFSWGGISYQDANKVTISDTTHGISMPIGGNGLILCVTGDGDDQLTITYIGNAPQYDEVCTKTVDIDGCGTSIDTSCASVTELKAMCDSGATYMEFKIKNNSGFTMRGVTIYSSNPDITPVDEFLGIADLAPNATSPVIRVPLNVLSNAQLGCFYFAACDQSTRPGTGGNYPRFCCMDSIEYCVEVPECGIDGQGGCNDEISMEHSGQDQSGNCCVNLTLKNRYTGGNIKYIVFRGIGGAQFSLFSGWSVIPAVSSNYIKVEAPGNGVSAGTYPDFVNFCLTGTSVSPHMVVTDYLDENGDYLCTDTLTFPDCQLVDPSCANIVNDSFYCENGRTKYTFSVRNNSPFDLYHIDLRTTDSTLKFDQSFIIPINPIKPDSIGGPFTITIDSMDEDLDMFCLYLTGHNAVYDPDSGYAATQCCTDSMGVICLPMIDCTGDGNVDGCDTSCCAFGNITVPTGLTPNADGKNDLFIIQNSNKCKTIGITVYIRWGSVLYEDADYKNNWGGQANRNGTLLAQGTYYVVIELEGGERKASFIDIRY
jgi:gliding motility-associated-like protein